MIRRSLDVLVSRALPAAGNILRGYHPRANPQKFRLLRTAMTAVVPGARSFADLGGVWNVDAAYTRYMLRNFPIERASLADTDFPAGLRERLSRWPQLRIVQGDFADPAVVQSIGPVDVLILFDVLLHQAHPHWNEVLARYADRCRAMVIYNQQWVRSDASVRLTDLPIEEYLRIVPNRKADEYRAYFSRRDEKHPTLGKRNIDIHNMWQWGISDRDLRAVMAGLGFEERFFSDHGPFGGHADFRNRSFIFSRDPQP